MRRVVDMLLLKQLITQDDCSPNSESVSASVENDIEPAEEPSASTEAEASR